LGRLQDIRGERAALDGKRRLMAPIYQAIGFAVFWLAIISLFYN